MIWMIIRDLDIITAICLVRSLSLHDLLLGQTASCHNFGYLSTQIASDNRLWRVWMFHNINLDVWSIWKGYKLWLLATEGWNIACWSGVRRFFATIFIRKNWCYRPLMVSNSHISSHLPRCHSATDVDHLGITVLIAKSIPGRLFHSISFGLQFPLFVVLLFYWYILIYNVFVQSKFSQHHKHPSLPRHPSPVCSTWISPFGRVDVSWYSSNIVQVKNTRWGQGKNLWTKCST